MAAREAVGVALALLIGVGGLGVGFYFAADHFSGMAIIIVTIIIAAGILAAAHLYLLEDIRDELKKN